MRIYLGVTGGANLAGFWKTSPAELMEWAEAKSGAGSRDGFEDMEMGEELED